MSNADILKRVRVEGLDYLNPREGEAKPVVLLLSHLSSWELTAQLLPPLVPGRPKATIYQRLSNSHIDAHIRETRARFGIQLFDRSEGFGKAIAMLRRGGVVSVLGDQHAGDHGVWTPFFARLASTTPLPALLAKRTGAQLIPFAIVTDGFARWRAIIDPPIETSNEKVSELSARVNQVIERQVRRAPADWFWVHNRWKTPNPNFLLSNYRRETYVPPGKAPLKPFRILVRSSNWLGDAVMSIPALRAIKAGRADIYLAVAAPAKIADLWREVREVDEVIPLPSRSLWKCASAIRRRGSWDVAVIFPNSLRSAMEAWLAGIPRRAGFAGHARRCLLHQYPREKPARGIVHQSIHYLQLAATLGADLSGAMTPTPLHPRRNGELKIGLCPGAEYGPAKRWPVERFAEVAQILTGELEAHWILFGTDADEEIGKSIARTLDATHCQNRIGQTLLGDLIRELRDCHLLLTNDTGTMHLAAFLGIPTVSIFGSTEPRRSAPLGPLNKILRHHVECSPCYLRECPIDFRCMRAVTVDEVVAAIRETLGTLRRKRAVG